MDYGLFVNADLVPSFVFEFVSKGFHQIDEDGGLKCFERWSLNSIPFPAEYSTCPPELLAHAAIELVASQIGSLDARKRYEAARVIYGVTALYGNSNQTGWLSDHLAQLGGEMAAVLALELNSEDESSRKLASFGLATLGPRIEPWLPEVTAAFERHPENAGCALVNAGPVAAPVLVDALREGPNSRREVICRSFITYEIHLPDRMEHQVLDAIVDCLHELETEDEIFEAEFAIQTASRHDPVLYAYLLQRLEGSDGVTRERLESMVEELADWVSLDQRL